MKFWSIWGRNAMAVYDNKAEVINSMPYVKNPKMKCHESFADAAACAIEGYNNIQNEAQFFESTYRKLTLPRNRMLYRYEIRRENNQAELGGSKI